MSTLETHEIVGGGDTAATEHFITKLNVMRRLYYAALLPN
jgi:hypothetical protein